MRSILLVAAERRELAGVLARCRRVERLHWPVQFARRAEFNGRAFVLVANGSGTELAGAAADAAREEDVDMVISTGYCGALDEALRPGDIFVATRVETPHGASYQAVVPRISEPFASGVLHTSAQVVLRAEDKRRLRETGAKAVDMEAAAVAGRAVRRGVAFCCVRAVTDTAEESFALDYNALREAEGRFSRWRIAAAALRRPLAGVPDVVRLDWRCRKATRALGEFLGDCQF